MRMFLIAVLCLLVLVVGSGSVHIDQHGVYQVLEGQVSLTGSEPLIDVLITDETGNSYTVHGPLRNELFRLCGMTVRVVGAVVDSTALAARGQISVERYVLVDPGYPPGTTWAIGVLREDRQGLLLVGDDFLLYRIIEPEHLWQYLRCRVILIGEFEKLNDHEIQFRLEGYKLISVNLCK